MAVDAALRLYHETDGIPLFVVETVRAGIAHAPEPGREVSLVRDTPVADDRPPLPPRVYSVIAGRLAHLSAPAWALLGLAAAMGRAFTLANAGGDTVTVIDTTTGRVVQTVWVGRAPNSVAIDPVRHRVFVPT